MGQDCHGLKPSDLSLVQLHQKVTVFDFKYRLIRFLEYLLQQFVPYSWHLAFSIVDYGNMVITIYIINLEVVQSKNGTVGVFELYRRYDKLS